MRSSPSAGTLVTGFLRFGRFAVNPSAVLASGCGRTFELIDVTFAAADAFIESLQSRDFDRLLLMGVSGSSTVLRLERQALNRVGSSPDASGVVSEDDEVEPGGPRVLHGTLWSPSLIDRLTAHDPRIIESDDAGDYLCNYIYFRALQRCSDRPLGFLHVPPAEAMELETQAAVLADILDAVEGAGLGGSRGV